jgi:uncharacterized membrane protein YeaQ/YmgE (transglycosylase-associated protein family)
MFASLFILADGVTVTIGNNSWSFGLDFVGYLVIATLVGLIAEAIVGGRSLPFGLVGAIIAAVVGIWLMTNVVHVAGIGDVTLFGVPLLRGLVGAVIFVSIWHLLRQAFVRSRTYRTV